MGGDVGLLSLTVITPALSPEGTEALVTSIGPDRVPTIVVDNATGAVRERLRTSAPWVRTIVPLRNLGFAAAVNLAVQVADTEIVFVTNDDVVLDPGALERLAAAFDDPTVTSASCRLRRPSGETDSIGLNVDRTLRAFDTTELQATGPIPRPIGPSGAAAAYRRSTFLRLGGFSKELFAYWEDVDLALRLWADGGRFVAIDDPGGVHRRGSALGGRTVRQRRLDAFGRGFVLGRYQSWLGLRGRAAVPLVDWQTLLVSAMVCRDLSVYDERRRGRRAGRASQVSQLDGPGPASRTLGATLRAQRRRQATVLASWTRHRTSARS